MGRLDVAAKALFDIECAQGAVNPSYWAGMKDRYILRVRAVLLAVREPGEDVVEVGITALSGADSAGRSVFRGRVPRSFTAMIDAILAEPPNT